MCGERDGRVWRVSVEKCEGGVEKCVGVWKGKGRCGEVRWSAGGGVGKCLGRCGKVCWGVWGV